MSKHWDATTLGLFLLSFSIPARMTAVMETVVVQYTYPYYFYFQHIAGSTDVSVQAEATSSITNALLPLYWVCGSFLCLAAAQQTILSIHGARGMQPTCFSTKRGVFAGAVLLGVFFLSFFLRAGRSVASFLAIILLTAGLTE
ncbi:hypothetical protein NIES2134_122450 [Thermostichus vulcanus NIES-2134]|nr:hypothetical protein NIES2134_122450 [Thermostichus vulcanus NIES-2134]